VIKKTFILPVLAVAALAAAGCGSGTGYGTATAKKAPAKTAAAQAPADQTPGAGSIVSKAPAAGAVAVDIANFAFAPHDIKAKVGQTITCTNQDGTAHTATATEGAKFDSGSLDPGASFSYTPKNAGTIKFACAIHPSMLGTITVS
jgi:plastocyanin